MVEIIRMSAADHSPPRGGAPEVEASAAQSPVRRLERGLGALLIALGLALALGTAAWMAWLIQDPG